MSMFRLLLMAMTAIAITACSDSDEPNVTPEQPTAPATPELNQNAVISTEAATEAAVAAINKFFGSNLSATDVASVERDGWPSKGIYVVTFDKGGYALVDADSLAPTRVMGVSDKGVCPAEALNYVCDVKNNYSETTFGKIRTVLPDCGKLIDDEMTGASWPTARWSVYDPYNKYCPLVDGKPAAAGAMAVAMAEVMAYHHTPAKIGDYDINWSQIWPFPSADATEEVARLVAQIGKQSGFSYLAEGTRTPCHKIAEILRGYGFANATNTTNPGKVVKQSIPSIGYGYDDSADLNTWVVSGHRTLTSLYDGVRKAEGEGAQKLCVTRDYLKFDWADGTNYGWYLAGNTWMFETEGVAASMIQNLQENDFVVDITLP